MRFGIGRVFLFFERLLIFSVCYHGVLYQLNRNVLFRFAIVVLLGCCEFKWNVTLEHFKYVSIRLSLNVCSRIACHMLSGSDRRLRAARNGEASGCFG